MYRHTFVHQYYSKNVYFYDSSPLLSGSLEWTVYLPSHHGCDGDKLMFGIAWSRVKPSASSFGNVGSLPEELRRSSAAESFSGRILSPSGLRFAEAPDSLMTSLYTWTERGTEHPATAAAPHPPRLCLLSRDLPPSCSHEEKVCGTLTFPLYLWRLGYPPAPRPPPTPPDVNAALQQ